MINLAIGVCCIAVGGLLSLLVSEKVKAILLSLMTGLGAIFISIPALTVLLGGKPLSATFFWAYPTGDIPIVIDALSAFFLVIISVMSFVGVFFSIGYLKPYIGKKMPMSSHFFFLSLLIISMILVVVVNNALAFLIVWEIMSVASFFLVIYENEKKEVIYAGINYLINMHLCLFVLMIGFVILSIKTGSFDFASFKSFLTNNRQLADLLFLIFFAGFGIKAGFIPFHSWLPRAHPAAPSHVSGIMSGVMIKTGVYGIIRILTLMPKPTLTVSYIVLALSIASAVYGIIYATSQKDIKKLLAYSSIENIGIIGTGIGIGMLGISYNNSVVAFMGFAGAAMHTLNHSLFKGLLFYGAGAIYSITHTRNMEQLGGLTRYMPRTSVLFLLGSLSITGLPPFNGFISELLIINGLFHSYLIHNPFILIISTISIAALAFSGAVAILCFAKLFSTVFLGIPRAGHTVDNGKPSAAMTATMSSLAAICLITGVFPQLLMPILQKVVETIIPATDFSLSSTTFVMTLNSFSLSFGIFILLCFMVYSLRGLIMKNKLVTRHKTWDCGYQSGTCRMQYSGASFAWPLLSLVEPVNSRNKGSNLIETLFPKDTSFKIINQDMVEKFLIHPVARAEKRLLNLLSWIQSGDTQMYIFYGLLSLCAALLWIMVVK